MTKKYNILAIFALALYLSPSLASPLLRTAPDCQGKVPSMVASSELGDPVVSVDRGNGRVAGACATVVPGGNN